MSPRGNPHWVTNYDDFDEVIVERIVAGRRIGCPIPAAEAAEAVRRLARDGYSDGQIAARLGFARRSVQRIRRKRGIPPALKPGDRYALHPGAPTRPRKAG